MDIDIDDWGPSASTNKWMDPSAVTITENKSVLGMLGQAALTDEWINSRYSWRSSPLCSNKKTSVDMRRHGCLFWKGQHPSTRHTKNKEKKRRRGVVSSMGNQRTLVRIRCHWTPTKKQRKLIHCSAVQCRYECCIYNLGNILLVFTSYILCCQSFYVVKELQHGTVIKCGRDL